LRELSVKCRANGLVLSVDNYVPSAHAAYYDWKSQGEVVDYVDWIRVDVMSDSKTFLLVHNNQAMTCDANGFGWMSITEAEQDESLSAQWNVTTDHDGFHLKNGLGYTLTYGPSGFYGTQSDASELNQVFYYLNNRLVVHNNDVYYQFGTNGNVVSSDGLAFTLYQKEVMTGLLTNIINEPVVEEDQTYVEVTKVWKDNNDEEELRPDSVTVQLYKNGEAYGETIKLSAANSWSYAAELPVYENGEKITWSVKEISIPRYYTVSYDQNTLTITNTIQSKDVPKSGDFNNLWMWFVLMGGCTAGAVSVVLGGKKKGKYAR